MGKGGELRDQRVRGARALPVPAQGAARGRAGPSLDGVVPYLHCPVGATRHEDLGVVGVPGHGIHGHVVGIVGVEELAGVGFGALGWGWGRVSGSGQPPLPQGALEGQILRFLFCPHPASLSQLSWGQALGCSSHSQINQRERRGLRDWGLGGQGSLPGG